MGHGAHLGPNAEQSARRSFLFFACARWFRKGLCACVCLVGGVCVTSVHRIVDLVLVRQTKDRGGRRPRTLGIPGPQPQGLAREGQGLGPERKCGLWLLVLGPWSGQERNRETVPTCPRESSLADLGG